jgi:hypothetical protein
VTISLDEMDGSIENIEIYDASMKLVKTEPVSLNLNKVTIAVNELERGMYFVLVGSKIKKLILN